MELFDKIKKIFFSEEDVYDVDLKDASFAPEKKEAQESVRQSKPKVELTPIKVEKIEIDPAKPIHDKKVDVDAPRKNINIVADAPDEKRETRPRLQPIERRDFEVPQVISPMKGVREDANTNAAVHSIPPIHKRSRRDSLGTIISPIYGNGEETQEISLENLQSEEQVHEVSQVTAAQSQVEEKETFDEEVENISLDQMVSSDAETEGEIIQFSLLGDDTSLKDLVNEESEEDEEDLPF